MGIFMGFLTLLSGLFVSTLDVQKNATETARIEQDSQYLFSRFQYDITRASQVVTPATNGSTTQTLELVTPSGNLTYSVQNNRLSLTTAAGTESLTSPEISVTSISFTKLGDDNGASTLRLQINLQSSYPGESAPESRELTYTFGIR
jgi:hypothetical protein